MKSLQLVLLVFALWFCSCKVIKFKNCFNAGKDMGDASVVAIEPCVREPCSLKKKSNVTVKITFTPKEDVTAVKVVVHGIIGGFPVPFPVDNPDGCKDAGLTCPLKNGAVVTYNNKIPIKSIYPCIKLIVRWELRDQNGKNLACILIPAQITA